MAKAKVTRKWIAENHDCFAVGYCDLQNLLDFSDPDYYTCGAYGWNFDAYVFTVNGRNVCLTTGYRNMINNFSNTYTRDLCRKYEVMASEIRYSHDIGYEDQKKKVTALLNKFLEEVVK